MSVENEDRYRYRWDGNFMVRVMCPQCSEIRDEHAMSNHYPKGDFCDACWQVAIWERESRP